MLLNNFNNPKVKSNIVKYLIWSKHIQKNLLKKLFFLICIFFFSGNGSTLYSQNKPLDNGDLEVVNKKDLQSETYISYSKRGPYDTFGLNTYLRYGIQKNFELQVEWSSRRSDNFFGDDITEIASVGIKAFLTDESKYFPGFSLIGSINLTTDPDTNPIKPAINVLFRKSISSNFKLTGNYQLILNEQSGDLSNDFAVNLDVDITNWLTSYVGVKGVKSYTIKDKFALKQEYVELGMLFWVTERLRIYPFYDYGLGDDSEDIISIGIMYLFN